MQLIEDFSQDERPKISVTFKDGRTMESRNPEDVLRDSFIQSTRIDEIKLFFSNFESKRTNDPAVIFRRGGSSSIRFIVAGERASTLMFERDLINELAASKQWYSPFVLSFGPWYALGAVVLVAILGLVITASNMGYITGHTVDLVFYRVFMPLIVILPLLLLFLGIAFPAIVFDLGDGARRQRRRTTVWSFIIGSVVVTLLVGLSTDFLKDWLTGSASGTHS